MNFSGIIEMDEIPAIQELLKDAKSFCCYGFDCYERYWDITDEEYLAQLETKREEITHEFWNGAGQNGKTCISQARLL